MYKPRTLTREEAKYDLMFGAHKTDNLCEKLRSIYDMVHPLDDLEFKEAITEKLIDAFILSKKIGERLWYLSTTYSDNSGNIGINIPLIPNINSIIRMRKRRKRQELRKKKGIL